MDLKKELIEALITFSKQADRIAKLLSTNIQSINDTTPIMDITDTSESINVAEYEIWPEANFHIQDAAHRAQLASINISSLNDLKVLEFSCGQSYPVSHYHKKAKVHIILDKFKYDEQPPNVKILKGFDEAENYDVGVIWESLEATSDPLNILMKMRNCCDKIIIRFRPWTSRDGAFQSLHFNKAFAHLMMDINTDVKYKVIRPLAEYETMLAKAGLQINERKINSQIVEGWFTNDKILSTIINRTWGKSFRKDEAMRIMLTNSVDYIVSK